MGNPVVEVSIGRQSSRLVDLAAKGDPSALRQLREALCDTPEVLEELGDLGRMARDTMLKCFKSGDGEADVLIREAQKEFLARLQKDIEGRSPTPVERLLAQEIAICRLHLKLEEIRYAGLERFTFSEAEFHQRMIDRAQRRYLAAIKTLAHVRRLQLPSVQVNVAAEGGRQINMMGTNS